VTIQRGDNGEKPFYWAGDWRALWRRDRREQPATWRAYETTWLTVPGATRVFASSSPVQQRLNAKRFQNKPLASASTLSAA